MIMTGLAILLAAGLPIAARLNERGVGSGGAFFGDLLGGVLILGAIVIVFSAIAFVVYAIASVVDWRIRLRTGDNVQVSMGVHKGTVGVVREPLSGGHRVRVELQLEGKTEIVDFRAREIRKIK